MEIPASGIVHAGLDGPRHDANRLGGRRGIRPLLTKASLLAKISLGFSASMRVHCCTSLFVRCWIESYTADGTPLAHHLQFSAFNQRGNGVRMALKNLCRFLNGKNLRISLSNMKTSRVASNGHSSCDVLEIGVRCDFWRRGRAIGVEIAPRGGFFRNRSGALISTMLQLHLGLRQLSHDERRPLAFRRQKRT